MYFSLYMTEMLLALTPFVTPSATSVAFESDKGAPALPKRQVAPKQNDTDFIYAHKASPGPAGLRVYDEPHQAGQISLASLYTWDFSWKVIWYNLTDPSKDSPPTSLIPFRQDGNCLARLDSSNSSFFGRKDNPNVRRIQRTALPRIKQNSDRAGGTVGNENVTGCTRLYEDFATAINYCGIGNATFDLFNATMQMLIGNCSSDTQRVSGAIWMQGVDRLLYNWIQV